MSTAPVDTALLDAHLSGCDDVDAYGVALEGVGPGSAPAAARCITGSGSGRLLLRARDLLVSPVGLSRP